MKDGVAVLGSPSQISLMASVDVKQHRTDLVSELGLAESQCNTLFLMN